MRIRDIIFYRNDMTLFKEIYSTTPYTLFINITRMFHDIKSSSGSLSVELIIANQLII